MIKKIVAGVTSFFIIANSLAAQDTQGFFINGHRAKKAVIPRAKKGRNIMGDATVQVEINDADTIASVSPYLFGNNTNPYMTQIVTEPELMRQLQLLSPNVLRFPGGNISNEYYWDKEPGNKPADVPDTILFGDNRRLRKSKAWTGKDSRPQSLSLENYYKLLQQTNSAGSICVNAGYARYGMGTNPIATAAHYAADWVRYDNSRTRFWEVGNEDYGTWQAGYKIDTVKNKDGQPGLTNGELYGRIFLAFSDSMHAAARETGATIYIGATLIEAAKNIHESDINRGWNEGFFRSAKNAADFFVVHSYFTPYQQNSTPDAILNTANTVTGRIMEYLKAMTAQYGTEMKPVALTEWNIFAERSKQQTSYVNGMHAAIVLGEMATHRYSMACRWDLANGYANGNDHGMFSKGDEPGIPKWSARPAFYYMYYFQHFFGDQVIISSSNDKNVLVYASTFSDGKKGVVLINKDSTAKIVSLHFNHSKQKGQCYSYTLTGGNDNGLFSQQVLVNGVAPMLPAGGPPDFENIAAVSSSYKEKITLLLPAMAVQYILITD
ncbi:MAG: alpha-L-arabinofuranosidase [Chitinophagaceae bacterium]